MDFSIPQNGNTRFMYVLPFSETEALIEYTLFSENTLPELEYEEAIKTYLTDNLHCEDYQIVEKEKGNIPMTCYNFNVHNSKTIMHIGIAGGWAKPSSGYTFMRTYQRTKALIPFLKKEKPLNTFIKKDRFWFYDLLLLDILFRDNSKGRLIFGQLFKRRSPQKIFKFLDEKTSLWEDLVIIAACPKKEFILAFLRRIFLI
jgi:lycopene beta-cyclase